MTVAAPSPESSSLGQVERHIFMRAVLSGVEVGPAAAGQLLSVIEEVFFPRGTTIYLQGEPSEHMYFVVGGSVQLSREGEEPWIMSERSAFGVLDAALEQPHARTARAIEDVHAMVMRVEDWQDIQEDHFELAQAMVLRNASQLHSLSLELAPSGGFEEPAGERLACDAASCGADSSRLDVVERLMVFSEAPLFARAGIQPLINLAQAAKNLHLQVDEELFRFGEAVSQLYLVARGIIEIERQKPTLRARLGPGSLVGGPAALANERRAFTARAVTDAVVLTLRREDMFDVFEDHYAALHSVTAYLAAERDRLQRLEAARGAPAKSS